MLRGRQGRVLAVAACNALAALVAVVVLSGGRPSAQSTTSTLKQAALTQAARGPVVFSRLLTKTFARRSTAARYASDHIVVKFDRDVTPRAIRDVARQAGAASIQRARHADFHYVKLAAGQDPVALAARMSGQDGVVYAEPDPIVRPLYTPNDEHYSYQWNFTKIGMARAWDINRGGSAKTTVAVLDTGVAYLASGAFAQAPELAGTSFVAGYDFIWDDDKPVDSEGHGTHVAGTIAQTTDNQQGVAGMAFKVNIMPIKVLSTDWDAQQHAPNDATMAVLAQGIRFAVNNGAKVINMSLGAEEPSSAVESAIRYAVSQGVFVAVAAGNSGDEGNAASWPAAYATEIEGVMAVAAVDYNLSRAWYSTHRDYVEIAAPGGDNDADVNGDGYADGILQQTFDPTYAENFIFNRFAYMFYQGTSMACPHVAAMAALLYDQGITSPAAIEAVIKATATNKPSGGRNDDIGYGIINVPAALRGLGLAK